MKQILTTINHRGQVTIPTEIRRLLGLKPDGKVTFVIDEGEVKLVPARFTLERAHRSVRPLPRPLSDKEMVRVAKEERALG